MKKQQWPIIAAILVSGIILGGTYYLLLHMDLISNPIIYLRGRLSALLLWSWFVLLVISEAHLIFIAKRISKQHRELETLRNEDKKNRHRFLQRLDHELKNPLTAIRAGLTNITSEPLSDYVAKEVTVVQSQAVRISKLVADLRKIASLEDMTLETVEISITDLLQETVDIIKSRNNLEDRELILITPSAPWPLPSILGDPDLILLAVLNLVDNALKFTNPGDTIEIRASEEGKYIAVEVADTGRGIPEEDLDRVWEDLYRGSQSHGIPGSGLGLPLVKAIMNKHGGKTTLRSKLGCGSVFCLFLPIP
jgi:two-component system OmpR family sensor kinase